MTFEEFRQKYSSAYHNIAKQFTEEIADFWAGSENHKPLCRSIKLRMERMIDLFLKDAEAHWPEEPKPSFPAPDLTMLNVLWEHVSNGLMRHAGKDGWMVTRDQFGKRETFFLPDPDHSWRFRSKADDIPQAAQVAADLDKYTGPAITWESLNGDVVRARIDYGWLVAVKGGRVSCIIDPEHKWSTK